METNVTAKQVSSTDFGKKNTLMSSKNREYAVTIVIRITMKLWSINFSNKRFNGTPFFLFLSLISAIDVTTGVISCPAEISWLFLRICSFFASYFSLIAWFTISFPPVLELVPSGLISSDTPPSARTLLLEAPVPLFDKSSLSLKIMFVPPFSFI